MKHNSAEFLSLPYFSSELIVCCFCYNRHDDEQSLSDSSSLCGLLLLVTLCLLYRFIFSVCYSCSEIYKPNL